HVAIEVMQEALGPDRRKLEGAEVEALNRALLARRLHEAAEDLDQMAGDAANRIWRSFEAKLDDHTVAVSVSVHVEGGQASRGYTLYRCEPDDGKRSWKERANWTGKVKDERDYPVAVMRPVAGAWPSEPEMVDALQGRLLTVIGSIATDRHLSRLHASSETEIKL
ncbi:MAG TPA: hypothetical protein VF972_11040, partial [Actinomycetota bacterium]